MKKKSIILSLLLGFVTTTFCQDSTVIYYSSTGKETTKDSSHHYTIFKPQGDVWFGMNFYSKNNILQSAGTYKENDSKTPIGKFNNYTPEGILYDISYYEDGKLTNRTYYFENGRKKSYIAFDKDNKIEVQQGWDSTGALIPGYIVMQEAGFKGGPKGWKKYLEKHLNSKAPMQAGTPAGTYPVSVSFLIDKEGHVDEVKVNTIPVLCKVCADEAIRVIKEAPDWQPAIQNNKVVKYRQTQTITFVINQ